MKKYTALFVLLILLPINALAEKTIAVDFSYPNNTAKEFRLYMDGKNICQTLGGTLRAMSCSAVEVQFGVHTFTMTAVEADSVETNHSPPYVWNYLATPGNPPLFLNFKITIDGTNIELKQ